MATYADDRTRTSSFRLPLREWVKAIRAALRRRPAPRPVGLLKDPDPEIAEAARLVSLSAPTLFGRLDELWLRGNYILMHPREKKHPHELHVLDGLVEEALRSTALQIRTATKTGEGTATLDYSAMQMQVENAEQFLARREGEIARHLYSHGLMFGVIFSVGLLSTLYAVAIMSIMLWTHSDTVPPDTLEAIRDIVFAVGGGAAGACVSVLLRLHHIDTLTIEAARGGAARYRIYLGWFFAAAMVFLLKSGMLAGIVAVPVTTDANRVSTWFFWGAIGFLAGFNERWATNLISRGPGEKADGTGKAAAKHGADPEPKP